MIREDRIQLNNRFIHVFKLLEERGDIVLNDRDGKGIGDFADKILGNRAYGHIVRRYLDPTDKRCIDYRQARILCNTYGINEKFMLEGAGSPFGYDVVVKDNSNVNGSIKKEKPRKGNILFTTTQAFAGATIDAGTSATEDLEYFAIPGVAGSGLVAFPVLGNSMEPVIHNDDIAICREVNGLLEVRDNEIYAVKNNGQLWVKYVQRMFNQKGRVTHLKLISANYLEHDPWIEEVNENTRLYKVIRKISAV
ncbi:MAG: S24 family peptidase [Saprospiraceae bacterium]|nr:S24 family peptidase [Saprospiraceae bacterium]MBP7699825.1 S24 family peptidase [Saprospiraceae bacterium]